MDKIITTERLYLRQFTNDDLPCLAVIYSDVEVMRYSMIGVMTHEQSHNILEGWINNYRKNEFAPWALVYEKKIIGFAGLDMRIINGEEKIQINFRLAKDSWGFGFATEIAAAIKNYAFEFLGLKELIAIVDPQNIASVKVLTKTGMAFDQAVLYEGLNLHVYSSKA